MSSCKLLPMSAVACAQATAGYQALVDTLNSIPFTVLCDDQELGWEVAQVGRANTACHGRAFWGYFIEI